MMETQRQKQRNRFQIWNTMLAAVVLVLMLVSSNGSLAYMKSETNPVSNTFVFRYFYALKYDMNGGNPETKPDTQYGYSQDTSFVFTIEHKKKDLAENEQYEGPIKDGCFFIGWSEEKNDAVIKNGWAKYSNIDSFGQLTTITVSESDGRDEELEEYGFSKTLYAQWGSQLIPGKDLNEAIKKLVNSNSAMNYASQDDNVHTIVFKQVGSDIDEWARQNGLQGDPEDAGKGIVVDEERQGNIKLYYQGNTAYILSQHHIFANEDSSYMFHFFDKLQSVEFNNFNTDKVKNMAYMFFQCTSALDQLDLRSFHTSKVENMKYMFGNCDNLKKIVWETDKFNTGQVQDMEYMFCNCSLLTDMDLSKFKTENVSSMSHMFANCKKIVSLDLSSFDISNVIKMDNMFHSCIRLEKIFVSNLWNTSHVANSAEMFVACGQLTGGNGTCYDPEKVDKVYARIDGEDASPGYLTDINAKNNHNGGV